MQKQYTQGGPCLGGREALGLRSTGLGWDGWQLRFAAAPGMRHAGARGSPSGGALPLFPEPQRQKAQLGCALRAPVARRCVASFH
jgi:hypothetical protein